MYQIGWLYIAKVTENDYFKLFLHELAWINTAFPGFKYAI